MKRSLILLAALAASGCSGLNVSWVATASYNTPASTTATLTPGAAPMLPPLPAPVAKP